MARKNSLTELRRTEGRGKFLNVLLFFEGLGLLLIFRDTMSDLVNPQRIMTILDISPTAASIYTVWQIVVFLLSVAIFIGLLQWKRIAYYAFIALFVTQIMIGIGFSLHVGINQTGTYFIYGLLLPTYLALWMLAIKSKWHLFS